MKLRFNTYDVVCGVSELQSLIGLRVNQVYDVDNKTYLIRLQGGEKKSMLLLESGIRFHTTAFEWPKNVAPSGFSMKLRKHLKNKRLEKLEQIGVDRIVDFQFGSDEAAYHIILELYDRGNIILTDFEYTILHLVRPHTEGDNIRFGVREKYPLQRARQVTLMPNEDQLLQIVENAEDGMDLRGILMPLVDCGSTVIDHLLIKYKIDGYVITAKDDKEKETPKIQIQEKTGKKKKKRNINCQPFNIEQHFHALMAVLKEIFKMMDVARKSVSKGYIIQKMEEKPPTEDGNVEHFYQNIEYQPFLFLQYQDKHAVEFDSFMLAVDEFYSTLEGQKIDMKALKQEREAFKKLSNVKMDHAKRLGELNKLQVDDKRKGELITYNLDLVSHAILVMRSAIATQMSWPDIDELVQEAQQKGDGVARFIKQLNLESNHIVMQLSDPYAVSDTDSEDMNRKTTNSNKEKSKSTMLVAIDLGLSAWANARKYYEMKRHAAQKEQKTINASEKALKSAEKKTQQTLRDVRTITNISKARKVYWFEKFYWFISSENYLVIGGRDAQQNELIVKRYMRPNDIYVHAEIQGAASVIIRNPTGDDVPPKTLLEAGTMAISYSVAWDAKVATNAYWVHSNQVSKTAPTGEFLGTGSFMIRGRKNFLPSCHLIMGLSLLFKLEESFVELHLGERKVRNFFDEENQTERQMNARTIENELLEDIKEDNEIDLSEAIDENPIKDEFEFPDTEVKIEHGRSKFDTNSHSNNIIATPSIEETDETTLIMPAQARKKQQQNYKKRKEEKEQKWRKYQQQHFKADADGNVGADVANANANANAGKIKRGQKSKLKKINAKYKDQDESERQIRMRILQSEGKSNDPASNVETPPKENIEVIANKRKAIVEPKPVDDVDGEEVENVGTSADVDMLDSLTGQPFENDELLFVIPVVAPYQALQSYKYKLKLTPGTGKRGHAAKTALTMFSKDKTCTNREKDLLKSIKEDALARNIPGKVKISAPQLQKYKK